MATFADTMAALSPSVWARLGESSGTTATDEQAVINGTYVNTPTLGVSGYATGATGITLAAASSQHVLFADNAVWDIAANTDASVCIAFKISSWPAAYQVLMARGLGNGGANWFVYLDTTANRITLRLSNTYYGFDFTSTLADGAWHLFSLSMDRSALATAWIDGADAKTADISAEAASAITGEDDPFAIGCLGVGVGNTPSGFLDGSVDEFAFWNGTLITAQQWADLHAAKDAGVQAHAEHSSVTFAAYSATVDATTLARHAGITVTAHEPLAVSLASSATAYAGVARITCFASEGAYSDLDSDSGGGAAVMAAYQPSVSVKATAQHASMTLSAIGVSEGYPGSVFAEHAAIVFSSGDLSHGAAAGHASIAAAAGDIDYDLGDMAGQASPQFDISAYNASVSSDYTHNALAGHASITVESYLSTVDGSTAAGHASITMSGYAVAIPAVPADLLVEVYDAVTLSVDVSLYVDVTLDVEVY